MNTTQQAVNACATLGELCSILNEYEPAGEYDDLSDMVDLTNLPTFGGITPANTREIWSWDAENVLLCDGGYYIEKRDPEAWYSKAN